MTLNIITFTSVLHDPTMVRSSHMPMFEELEKRFDHVNILTPEEAAKLGPEAFKALFIATGGVESQVKDIFDILPNPALLIADGTHNSLAASLEISTFLRQKGFASEVIHGSIEQIADRLVHLCQLHQVRERLAGKRVGVIGTPSDWLIASGVSPQVARDRWGLELVEVPLERVYAHFDAITEADVKDASEALANRAEGCVEPNAHDIVQAMRLAEAIRRIVREDNLSAITLACFRLLDRTKTTGCMALSVLTDEGIMAGCEGDLQTLLTMMIVQAATGKASFMANPSRVNPQTNEVILAHCTIGLDQTESFILRNHFESLSGVAVQGIIPEGDVTVIKIGGPAMDRFFVTDATIIENLNNHNMCRTQVRLKFDRPADYYLRNSIGNHHVIVQGHHAKALADLLTAAGCHRVE
ncbi:MAG: fucose isomerase [Bacteroidales bacterium]|nr:fucose isomerase [Bacteroidales bacterium]